MKKSGVGSSKMQALGQGKCSFFLISTEAKRIPLKNQAWSGAHLEDGL